MKLFKEFLAILIIGLITGIFFYKSLFLGHLPLGSDIIAYQYLPWRAYQTESMIAQNPLLSDPVTMFYPQREIQMDYQRKGIMARWNPYLFCGTPGIESLPFYYKLRELISYPFCIFEYLVSAPIFYTLITLSYQFFAGLFMYLFLRFGLTLGKFGSLIGGIVFMLNGVFSVWLEFDYTPRTSLWFPLVLLLVEKTVSKRSLIYSLLTGLTLRALGENPLFFVYFLLILLFYLPFRLYVLYHKDTKKILKASLFIGCIFIIWFLLKPADYFQRYKSIIESHRVDYKFEELNPLPKENLVTLIVPDFYGTPIAPHTYGPIRDWFYRTGLIKKRTIKVGGENYNEYCCYFGSLPLILAIFLMMVGILRREKDTLFLSLLWIFSLGLALGTFLYLPLYYLIPGIAKVGISRSVVIFTLFGSILAGMGAEGLLRLKRENVTIIRIITLGLIMIILGLMVFFLLPKFPGSDPISRLLSWHFSLSNPGMSIPLLLLTASIIILLLSVRDIHKGFLKGMILFVVSFDLLYFGMKYNPMTPKEWLFPETPSLNLLKDKLKEEPPFRIVSFGWILPPNTNMVYRLQSIEGYEGLHSKRYHEFMKELVSPDIYHNWVDIISLANRRILQLLNVRYILVDEELKDEDLKLIYNGEIRIYEDLEVLPRAWIVPEAKVLKTKEEIFEALRSPGFDPKKTVILEEVESREYRVEGKEPRTQNLKPKTQKLPLTTHHLPLTKIVEYQPERVTIEASLAEDGYLLLSDSYYPGWRVFVDGSPAKILRANYIMRAVQLKEGHHKVEFIYDPSSFKLGLYISLATLFLIIILAVYALYTRKTKELAN